MLLARQNHKKRAHQPCRPALYKHTTVCHKKEFKAKDGTHTNKVEGNTFLIKGPCKAMKGLPKNLIPQYLDQMMFESWTNSVLPFSKTSHSQAEKDKMANVIAMLIAGLSFLHCQDEFEWEFETNYVSDGGMIDINENLYDYYKDQGHAVDDSDVPADDASNLDANYNENALFEQIENTLE